MEEKFYTLKGYNMKKETNLTNSMEDYLEMICRLMDDKRYIRVNSLAEKLNVKPSSASKMVLKLKEQGYVYFEKYGVVMLTEKGKEQGKYLLYRHDILHKFFCLVNKSENELEQVEQIEHFINRDTIENIERFMENYTEQ
mgnify:FL=1